MPPTFSPIQDGEQFRPEITRERGGYRGVRHGWIDTGDLTEALLDTVGLPADDESWSARAPNLRVVKVTIVPWSGDTMLARIDYATPGLGGGVLQYPAKPGKPITISVPSTTTVTATLFELKEVGPVDKDLPLGPLVAVANGDPPIAQGQGVPREVGLLEERVKVAYNLAQVPTIDFARILDLHSDSAINSEAVNLPNYFGTGYAKPAAAGTLRYRIPEFELEGDLFVITHTMASAKNHAVAYAELDEDGNTTRKVFRGVVNPFASFAGLW